ncbi:MAG: PadR family transcriptional regulator [Candidatus Thermoplasmatota archaeon]|nr:PadR family transcriptional regulator [Candidatus Thermoplasmatota archaeon]
MKTEDEDNFVKSEMRKTMLKIHVLWRLTRSETNAYTILKEISGDKFAAGFYSDERELRDSLYNSMRSLERSGLVVSSPRVENGRLKQYYQITEKGERVLKSSVLELQKGVKDIEGLFGE